MNKLLVLGIDAASWGVIDEGIEQGKMPFFQKLKENGVYGILESTNPPRTCPAWPVFMTGKNPGKLGIYGFQNLQPDYTRKVNSYDSVKEAPYWDLLADDGYTSGVLNVPVTWPPRIKGGFLVSGLMTPSQSPEEGNFAVPGRLEERLKEAEFLMEPNIDDYSEDEFRDVAERVMETRVDVTLELAEEEEWEVLTSVIRITDPFQHKVWREGHKQKVVDFFSEVDKEVERLVKGIQEQEDGKVNVIILSDHGFGRVDHTLFHGNRWLKNHGWLELEESTSNRWKHLLPLDTLYNLATKLGVKNVRKYAPQKVLGARNAFNLDVDWENTTALFNAVEDRGLIYINQEDRFERGTVSKADYEKVRTDIAEELEEVEDPKTGEKIVDRIHFREDLYHGPHVEEAPDMLVEFKKGYRGRGSIDSLFSPMAKERRYAVHTSEGILAAIGPDIREGEEIQDTHIQDIAPTVLHVMGCPVLAGMDGKVIRELFSRESEVLQETVYREEDEVGGVDL